MKDHSNNKPIHNRMVGVVTSLFIACAGASVIGLTNILGNAFSECGLSMEDKNGNERSLSFWRNLIRIEL